MIDEELVDVTSYLEKPLADELNGMTKKKLLQALVPLILKSRVQQETIEQLESDCRSNEKQLDSAYAKINLLKAIIKTAINE